eukprot:SAG31_NODE_1885_length_6990_cov_2.445218_4_plen_183_part_00
MSRLSAEPAQDVASSAEHGRLFEFALQASKVPWDQQSSPFPRLDRATFVRFMAPASEFTRLVNVTTAAVQKLRRALASCGRPAPKLVELLAAHAHSVRGSDDDWDRSLTVHGFLQAMAAAGLGPHAGLSEADLAFVVAELAGDATSGMKDMGAVTMPVKRVCSMLLDRERPAAPPMYTPTFT